MAGINLSWFCEKIQKYLGLLHRHREKQPTNHSGLRNLFENHRVFQQLGASLAQGKKAGIIDGCPYTANHVTEASQL